MRAVHAAILHQHVTNVARRFAANGDAAVPVLHDTIADDNVLAGNGHAAPVTVASALDGDAVVAGVELAVVDQDVGRGFRIAAVVIRTVTRNLHVTHGDVFRENGVDLPHRRIANRDVFNQNVGASNRLNELRTQPAAFAVHAILHRNVL